VYTKSSLDWEAVVFPQFALCHKLPVVEAEYPHGTRKSLQKRKNLIRASSGKNHP
jgi:hypothetical protein